MFGSYPETRRVGYEGGATFVPICTDCGRYVKADESIHTNKWDGRLADEPNATCSKCGRTKMLFEGFI